MRAVESLFFWQVATDVSARKSHGVCMYAKEGVFNANLGGTADYFVPSANALWGFFVSLQGNQNRNGENYEKSKLRTMANITSINNGVSLSANTVGVTISKRDFAVCGQQPKAPPLDTANFFEKKFDKKLSFGLGNFCVVAAKRVSFAANSPCRRSQTPLRMTLQKSVSLSADSDQRCRLWIPQTFLKKSLTKKFLLGWGIFCVVAAVRVAFVASSPCRCPQTAKPPLHEI